MRPEEWRLGDLVRRNISFQNCNFMKFYPQPKRLSKQLQYHLNLLFPEVKHYSDTRFGSHSCLFCWSAPARGPQSLSPCLSQFPRLAAISPRSESQRRFGVGEGGRESLWLARELDS